MMNNMMEKIQEMQQAAEASRAKLDTLLVEGEAGSGTVKVQMNGNRAVKNISIDPMLLEQAESSCGEIEDLLVIAFNRALEKATRIHEEEMQRSAMHLLPGLT